MKPERSLVWIRTVSVTFSTMLTFQQRNSLLGLVFVLLLRLARLPPPSPTLQVLWEGDPMELDYTIQARIARR